MADHSFGNIALAILPMASVSTITGLTTSVNTAQGLVLGVGTTGEGNSGIELPTHTRVGLELARIGNGRQADTFIREEASGLKITFPLGGARNTVSTPTVLDADFDLSQSGIFPGFDAILKAVGLTGAAWASAPIGWEYKASGSATAAAIALFAGGFKVVYQNALVTKLTIKAPPGEVATVEAEFSTPSVNSWGAQTLSTITQGNQATACPVVQAAAFTYGNLRPYESIEISLSPTTENAPDSNTANGLRSRQTAFDVEVSGLIYAADSTGAGAPDVERTTLISESPPTSDALFQIGTAAVAAGVAKAYAIDINNATVRKGKMRKAGDYLQWESTLEARCISSAGTEFTLRFL